MYSGFLVLTLLWWPGDVPEKTAPTAQALIARHEKTKSPVWVDGDTATFFYRGDAEQVLLMIGGEEKQLQRLPDSDVWTTTVTRKGMAQGVFTYMLMPGKKGASVYTVGKSFRPQAWRGPEAPPAPAKAVILTGTLKIVDFASKALGETRAIKVYLPPGHDKSKSYPVIYATDGNDAAHLLEALITSGKVPPLVVIAASSGAYQGDRTKAYESKKDLRALEYLAGIDADRYRKHATFFCEELPAWAEKEFGASRERKDRAVLGCSNGGRFAVDIGIQRPDLYGHVFAFSVAGRREIKLPEKTDKLPYFHLAAGTWETGFHKTTTNVAEALKQQGVAHTFISRVAGHDFSMWEDELVAAAVRAFGSAKKADAEKK